MNDVDTRAWTEAGLLYERRGAVQLIGFNRPERRNAMTGALYDASAAALKQADADNAVRAIVLHGDESAFCAGNDIDDFARASTSAPVIDAATGKEKDRPSLGFMFALSGVKKPVIAAVNGPAVGIGATMLLHCDFVYAGREARLIYPFVKLGICPEFASTARLVERVGRQRASQLLMLSTPCTADEAQRLGLVNEVLEPAEVLPRAIAIAEQIAKSSADAIRTTKMLLDCPDARDTPSRIRLESSHFSRLLKTPEAQAAFDAFLNKKK